MADDFVPSDPEFTVVIVGPNGKEWINVWRKKGQYGEYWSGKDKRGNYVNVNTFVPREKRQQQDKPVQESNQW